MSSRPLRDGAPSIPPVPGTPEPEPKASLESQTAPVAPAPSTANDLDYSNFFWGSGKDPFDILGPFDDWFDEARPAGYYLFGQPMSSAPRSRVDVVEQLHKHRLEGLINLASYNYLGLSYRAEVIDADAASHGARRLADGRPRDPR